MKYNRIIFEGKTYSGEVWSSGLSFADVTLPVDGGIIEDFAQLSDWAQAVFTQFQEPNYQELYKAISASGTVERVRAEARDGSSLLQAAESSGTAYTGTSVANQPAQVARVISLRTGRPGRSYRGRMYWPSLTAVIVPGTGKLDPTNQLATLNNAIKMIKMVRDQANTIVGAGSDIQPVIYSSTLDLVTPVTKVQVGDVLDTQRRRRDRLQESYVEGGLS